MDAHPSKVLGGLRRLGRAAGCAQPGNFERDLLRRDVLFPRKKLRL
jgi:hypothetical protein